MTVGCLKMCTASIHTAKQLPTDSAPPKKKSGNQFNNKQKPHHLVGFLLKKESGLRVDAGADEGGAGEVVVEFGKARAINLGNF